MRFYISGPMTSMPDHNIPAFRVAAERLRAEGHFVINPAELSAIFGTPEEIEKGFFNLYMGFDPNGEYKPLIGECCAIAQAVMDADLAAVRSCDAIYLLDGWKKSRGAKRELEVALKHDLKIVEEGESDAS